MVSWQKPRLGQNFLNYLIILLQGLVCCLLVYALIISGGDIVVYGCQKVGFYNYCSYNKTLEDCQCITELEELSLVTNTTQYGLVLAIILTYSSLVTVFMALLTVTFAHCLDESILWKFTQGLNVISLAGLSLGTTIYLFLTWNLLDMSQVTSGFLALLGAISTLPLLCCFLKCYIGPTREFYKSKTVSTANLL